MYPRQAYVQADGCYLFWGGVHVGNVGGGVGMIADHVRVASRLGIDVRYRHKVIGLIRDSGGGRITGVRVTPNGGPPVEAYAESVILAAGGFESNAALRKEHLGNGWENAKVRGTQFNRGEVLLLALDAGAARSGGWGSAHSVQWDAFAKDNESNKVLTNRLTRQGYPLGILVNTQGERFLDEGANFRNYTYAKYGKEVLHQPGSLAYQIFDATTRALLKTEEYDMPGISVVVAETIPELASKIGVDEEQLTATMSAFNGSIDRSMPFDPTILDRRSAATEPPKSNWACPLETSPYYAFPVTCGITFTFGGLKSDTYGRVLDANGRHLEGLYVAGEMLGGLFSGNYPGGSGLAAGAVFGRRAGSIA